MRLFEIINLALQSIKANKLRAMLTIIGVVVGLFSIIVIMTVLTMLQKSIEGGLSQLNKNTFQIEKFDRNRGGGPAARAKYRNRADITIEDYFRLKDMLKQAKYIGAEQWQFGKVAQFQNVETNPNLSVCGVTPDGMRTNNWNVDMGRDLRESDLEMSGRVCLLGRDVVDALFPSYNPIGLEIRVDGEPMTVIGVLEKQPQLFGQSRDNYIVLPITTFQQIYGKHSRSVNITVMSESKEDYNETIEAAIGYMRTIRNNKPGQDNDFYVFSNDTIIGQVNDISGNVKIGAMVVSIIALLAAGVGIMNIMLVSVTERTREIGIRKAIGARKSSILVQFLSEAIVLCLIGGLIGIMLGVGVGNLAGGLLNATAAIPWDWVGIGLATCVFVGVLFGTYPAIKASNLDPIEALRYE